MKKLLILPMLALTLTTAYAQDSKVKKEVKKDANAVGNKTSEVATKTAAAVVDQRYKDKVGPDGQTIYIDNHSKYYYVDKKGHHIHVTKAEMKDKK